MRHHGRRPLLARLLPNLRGLRPRLIVGFVLVAVASGSAAAGVSYIVTREAVLTAAQDDIMLSSRQELNKLALDIELPPDQAALDQLARSAGSNTLVVYGERSAESGGPRLHVSDGLRNQVHNAPRLAWQRERWPAPGGGETPMLVYGSPIVTSNGVRTGIEVYRAASLQTEEDSIARLAESAGVTLAISLLAAVLIALAAARGVLRPVRDLGRVARRLAAGELDVRLRPTGADELADLVMTFNGTAAALERSVNELRSMEANARRFVADVSHELRTPLAAMTAVTDTLDEEAHALDGDAGTAARLISAETRKLAALVEDLIEVSRFDAGRALLHLSEVDVHAEIAATVAARGWTASVEVMASHPVVAQVDRRRLDVIVANLAGNALKHGGAPVHIEVTAADTVDAEIISILVRDHGPGLSPDVLPHVFERFYKADSARARSGGSGLGLAIALENARLHGGAITAANHPDGGALFTASMPRWHGP